MSKIDVATFRELLKTELPRLLREHPESRHGIWGLMLESFPSRQEFTVLHQGLRDFREDTDRRFESLGGQMHEGFQAARQERQDLGGQIAEVREDLERWMQEGFQAVRQDLD